MPVCPICQAPSAPLAWRYERYEIFGCPQCQLQFVHPMASAPLDYYRERYGETMETTLKDEIHPGFRYIVNQLERAIQKYLAPHQRRAIDVGCGPGYMLFELTRMGFNALGIDFN